MKHQRLCSLCLIAGLVLGTALPASSTAPLPNGCIGYCGPVGAYIAAAAAGVAAVVILVVYKTHKKRTITGCVASSPAGLTITDEKNKRVYLLSGSPTGVTAGERMKLRGKKAKSNGSNQSLTWETREVVKDFGLCQP